MKDAMRIVLLAAAIATMGCAPEVGSESWCEALKDKPKGDWTANEAANFAKHCLI